MQIVDADGHVQENVYLEEMASYMPKGSQTAQIFPPLDHFHTYHLRAPQREEGARVPAVDADDWVRFLDDTGIDWTVVYPTRGLAVGRITSNDWAVAACRAYNNWLHDHYTSRSPRIKGVALIPIQDPQAAARELERAVKDLGMYGAMLPSTGEGIKAHFGDSVYDPIYQTASSLNCALAVHGGCHHHLGLDSFGTYYPVHALGHPLGIIIQAAAMLSHGVFERFPRLRVGFLEGGAAWVPFFLDRMNRSYEGHIQVDLDGNPIGPNPAEGASRHFCRLVKDGRIFVGFDCDDEALGYAVQRAGREAFLFASDYPHESINAAHCRHEIDELLEREDMTQADKEAVLGANALRFYQPPR